MLKIKRKSALIYLVAVVILLRVIETVGIYFSISVGEREGYISFEFLGLLADLSLLFSVTFLFQFLFRKRGIPSVLHYLGMFIFHLLLFNHFLFIIYFFNQRVALGRNFYMYTYDEIMITAMNSGYSQITLFLLLFILILFFFLLYLLIRRLTKQVPNSISIKKATFIWCISLLFLLLESFLSLNSNTYFANKSKVFYIESIDHFVDKYNPVDYSFDKEKIDTYQSLFPKAYLSDTFPLLHLADTTDYLADYIGGFTEKPNIVILFVEGMSADYVSDDNGITLMPFLDSLKQKSLYWENCFTLGERSFAVVPSVLASSTYGPLGFMQLEGYPRFSSLVSVLKSNGYYTRFNYGLSSWFHSKDLYFGSEGIDLIYDKRDYPKHHKPIIGLDGYFMGYNDKILFDQSLINMKEYADKPYVDIFFTSTMHTPHIFPNSEAYMKKFQNLIRTNVKSSDAKDRFEKASKAYITTMYTDDMLKEYLAEYSKKPSYENTIFIITGDHPMSDIPSKNSLKKYHVPLFIFSPKITKAATSKNFVSHLDVMTSLYAILKKHAVNVPTYTAALGENLKVEGANKNRSFVFMNGHRFLEEIYHNGYYRDKKQLYQVKEQLQIIPAINPVVAEDLEKRLKAFQWMSMFSTTNQNLLSVDVYLNSKDKALLNHAVQAKKIETDAEFINLQEYIFKADGASVYDFYLKHHSDSKELRFVFNLNNGTGNYWYSDHFIFKDPGTISRRINLPTAKSGDVFTVYIWNPDREKMTLDYFEGLLYH